MAHSYGGEIAIEALDSIKNKEEIKNNDNKIYLTTMASPLSKNDSNIIYNLTSNNIIKYIITLTSHYESKDSFQPKITFLLYTKKILTKKNLDELGRNIKLDFEDDDYNIIKISPYRVPEQIHDYQTKNRINLDTFINKY